MIRLMFFPFFTSYGDMVVFSVSFFLNANAQYKSIDREEQQIAIIKMKPNCKNKELLGVN